MTNAPKQGKVLNVDDISKYIEAELKEYGDALAFVLLEIDGPKKVQYSALFQQKKAEYEGAIAALNGVRDRINAG